MFIPECEVNTGVYMLTQKLEYVPVVARDQGPVSSLDTPHCVFSYKVSLLNLEFTSRMDYLANEFDSPVLAPSAPRSRSM